MSSLGRAPVVWSRLRRYANRTRIVKSFWSVTMYDGKTQLFIDNALDRYLLNSTMMEQFKRQDDGSLVFHVSQESPGPDLESNWLPAPDGPFYLVRNRSQSDGATLGACLYRKVKDCNRSW